MAESRGTGECSGGNRGSASRMYSLPADAVEGLTEGSPPADAEAGLLEGGAPVEASGVPSNADPKDDLFGPEEAKELISAEAAQKRNQKWVEAIRKEAQELSEPVPVVNLTFMEPIASPAADEIVTALSKSHARAKSLGVPVYRLHTDRERSFTTKSISTWCLERQVSQTLNAGDEPEANGRVAGEVLQFKRRLRLLLADSKANTACWPRAARHGTEERLRSQMRKLGAPCKEMPKFAVFGPNEGQKVASSQRRGTFCTLQNYEDYGDYGAITAHDQWTGGAG